MRDRKAQNEQISSVCQNYMINSILNLDMVPAGLILHSVAAVALTEGAGTDTLKACHRFTVYRVASYRITVKLLRNTQSLSPSGKSWIAGSELGARGWSKQGRVRIQSSDS